jgi:GntR family transcriptional regulator
VDDNALIPRIDPDSPTPIYHQIKLQLETLIQDGILQPGDQLPSERILAEQLDVSRMTIRQAVRAMVVEGYCERIRGRGIFVRKRPVIIDSQSFEGFTANIARQGLTAETRGVGARLAVPPDWVREDLDLDADALTAELTRLRLIDGIPAILETEWFPAEGYASLIEEDLSQSLYGILDARYGLRITSTNDVLHAYLPDDRERKLLGITEGTPVIIRFRVGSLADGTPIEIVRSVYHPDQYEFRMTLVPATTSGDRTAISPA